MSNTTTPINSLGDFLALPFEASFLTVGRDGAMCRIEQRRAGDGRLLSMRLPLPKGVKCRAANDNRSAPMKDA